VVLDGARRLLAAKRAGLATVPVILEEEPLSDAEVTHRQLVLDAQRVGLNAIERAGAIRQLMDQSGWSAAQVAVKLGASPSNVSKLLTLLVLPEDAQQRVAGGHLAMSTAYELARVSDPLERERLTAQAVSGLLTRERIAKQAKAKDTGSRRPTVRLRTPRERISIALGSGRSVVITASELSVPTLVALVEDCLARIRAASANSRTLAEVVQALSIKQHPEKTS
jgi:ParB family chromosome partitioning protein